MECPEWAKRCSDLCGLCTSVCVQRPHPAGCVRWDCRLPWELLPWRIVKAVTSPPLWVLLSPNSALLKGGRKTIGLGASDPDLGICFLFPDPSVGSFSIAKSKSLHSNCQGGYQEGRVSRAGDITPLDRESGREGWTVCQTPFQWTCSLFGPLTPPKSLCSGIC